MANFFIVEFIDLNSAFERVLTFYMHLQQVIDGSFKFWLNISKLLVDLVSKHFTKHCYIVIFSWIALNGRYDTIGGLDR